MNSSDTMNLVIEVHEGEGRFFTTTHYRNIGVHVARSKWNDALLRNPEPRWIECPRFGSGLSSRGVIKAKAAWKNSVVPFKPRPDTDKWYGKSCMEMEMQKNKKLNKKLDVLIDHLDTREERLREEVERLEARVAFWMGDALHQAKLKSLRETQQNERQAHKALQELYERMRLEKEDLKEMGAADAKKIEELEARLALFEKAYETLRELWLRVGFGSVDDAETYCRWTKLHNKLMG